MNGHLYLALLFILIGILYIINKVFHRSIPIFRIAVGYTLIYIGSYFFWIQFHPEDSLRYKLEKKINENKKVLHSSNNEHTVLFGKATIDLNKVTLEEEMELNPDYALEN